MKQVVADTGAEAVRMVFQAPAGEGLDVNEEFIRQAIDHAAVRGYGWVTAKGPPIGRGGALETFDTRTAETAAETTAPADPETGEVTPTALKAAANEVAAWEAYRSRRRQS